MSPEITIIGLGPDDYQYWTGKAYQLLHQAETVYVRTIHHPSVADIPAQIYGFDHLFENVSQNFEAVYEEIAAEIIQFAKLAQRIFYAVPGHPSIDEPTVPYLRTLAKRENVSIKIIPGVSLLEAIKESLNLAESLPLQTVRAEAVARLHHPPLSPDYPALITHLSHSALAKKVEQVLLNAYPENFKVLLLEQETKKLACPLTELSKQDFSPYRPSVLYLPPVQDYSSFATFQETIAHLRAPEGCPWDRKQTHLSLRSSLLEECYEVLEAIDANDRAALAEELGDLLLQIVLHTQIAVDTKAFQMGEVIGQIQQKLIRRHPHVFGDLKVENVEEVNANWEAIKQAEKATQGEFNGEFNGKDSALVGIPPGLPALAQAMKISKKAVRAGFEWPNIEGVLDKLIEEAQEIIEATDSQYLEMEIGDFLFSAVNLARWKNIDPESALRAMNARFINRFQKMEHLVAAEGKSLAELSAKEFEIYWNAAKSLE